MDDNETNLITEDIAMSSYKTSDKNWYAPKIPTADSVIRIKFNKMSPSATLPSAQREGDIGFDLYCDEDFTLTPGKCRKVTTNIRLADMPLTDKCGNRLFLKIEGRSGLAARGVFPSGGIIDPTYRGEIGVILNAVSSPDIWPDQVEFRFKRGDRIAQLVVYKVAVNGEVLMEETHDNPTSTARGANGFGSSGV
jgi:dUTP pyrophosphatase